jgi:hypothetical protein
VSITRCPEVAKELGKVQGALASAIDHANKAAVGWAKEGWSAADLFAWRRALAEAVHATTALQSRFRHLATEAWPDVPPPPGLFPAEEA